MDPAGQRRALESQDHLLGRHGQAIQILLDNMTFWPNARLICQILMRVCLRSAAAVATTCTAASTGPDSVGPRPDSYTCDPEPFDRNLDCCRGFSMQCKLVCYQRPCQFPSNMAKMNYIISLLRGRSVFPHSPTPYSDSPMRH